MDSSKTASGRKHWSAGQRQQLLTRFHQNEMTPRDFATQHGIGLSTLSKWLRLERDAVPAKVKFQEVRLPKPVKMPARSSTSVVAVQSRDDFSLVWSNIFEMSQNEVRSS